MCPRIAVVFSLALLASHAAAAPPSREEFERQSRVLEDLKESVRAEATNAGKFAVLTQLMTKELDVGLRRRILEFSLEIPGPGLEPFLTELLKTEQDAGLRSQAATALGRTGSEACLAVLGRIAASDPTTTRQIGSIRDRSSARRAATFAIADLASRFPRLSRQAAAALRALPAVSEPGDRKSLADARRQALYQVTKDDRLLKPFFDQLANVDPQERKRGVVAFRFLKMKKAPPEVVAALDDPSTEVRSWAALVLGEIRDPKSIGPLMNVAADTKADRGVRCNAIAALGQMRASSAADLMEQLLTDHDVSANAAIALHRITGKKTKQFPKGYQAD